MTSGYAGKAFIGELARLHQAYANDTSLECVALMACSVAPILLLQKPSCTNDHYDTLTKKTGHVV